MASIILSFVGQQDPFGKTNVEGSIVTLTRHLIVSQYSVKRFLLLYTHKTEANAIETRDWLCEEIPEFSLNNIELLPVTDELSEDPVNPLLAIDIARKALTVAKEHQNEEDILELNASSGTPAMKASWSVLQALGYATARSHVWQVRNPSEMNSKQSRVFYADVNYLKEELDRKIIQQQVLDYNYSGAIVTLRNSNLNLPVVMALLEYGFYRYSMNFNMAYSHLNPFSKVVNEDLLTEIATLRGKKPKLLLQEAYFNALVRLKNRMYADFLVALFKIQENLLFYLVVEKYGIPVFSKHQLREESWNNIKQVNGGELYVFLQNYHLPSQKKLDLTTINRYTLQAILEYYASPVIEKIQYLNQYCDQRNRSVHEIEGVSELLKEEQLLGTLRSLMRQELGIPKQNPFDFLNQQILDYLG